LNTSLSSSLFTRALVLGGGGAAGNAWQIGFIAGASEAGIDLTQADLIVGTSSGSTVAAQITGTLRPAELYAAILSAPASAVRVAPGSDRGHGPRSGSDFMEWTDAIIASATDPADLRRRLGAASAELDLPDGTQQRWHDTVAARLSRTEWPQQRIAIAAVNAVTGEPVAFDTTSGVELVDAVAASSSNGSGGPYRIGDNLYLNGGYRRNENADLAAGFDRVLVLSPFGGRSRMPAEWGMDLATQVAELRAGGSEVETVFPEAGAGDAFNANALDPSTRVPAARGGHEQGRSLAPQLAAFWN
jgi:NTE family protein